MRGIVIIITILALLLVGCGQSNELTGAAVGVPEVEQVAKEGDSVTIEYQGTLENGEPFYGEHGNDPLTFVIGEGRVIAGFEKNVAGMKVGDAELFTIPAVDAYGERRDDLIRVVPKDELSGEVVPGDFVAVDLPGGIQIPVEVTAVEGNDVTVDMNHPYSGQAVYVNIKLVSIN